jgi:hypothetical protein
VDGVNVLYTMNNSEARQHLGLACPSEEAKAALAAAPPDSLDRRLWEWTETYGWHHLQVFFTFKFFAFSHCISCPPVLEYRCIPFGINGISFKRLARGTPVKFVEGLTANGWCIAEATRSWYSRI